MKNRINTYYKFEKDKNTKTKFQCIGQKGTYQRLEMLRNKKDILNLYLVSEDYTKSKKTNEFKLIGKGVHISRVIQSKSNSKIAFGDFKHTNDLLIFIFNDNKTEFELLIATNKKYECNLYLNMLFDGILNDEIAILRKLDNNSNRAA
jgi:hypothetical protein